MSYETETQNFDSELVTVYYFENPMYHEDWHKAEEMQLVYIRYIQYGPDFWDDRLMFVPANKEKIVVEHEKAHPLW